MLTRDYIFIAVLVAALGYIIHAIARHHFRKR